MRARFLALVGWAYGSMSCGGGPAPTSSPDEAAPPASSSEPSSAELRDDCLPGGPSIALSIRRLDATEGDLPRDQLQGALMGWIGSIVQPCLDLPSEARKITLVFHLGGEEKGEPTPPVLEFLEAEAHPGMEACLVGTLAGAMAPPPGHIDASIVVPWGCPTLPPGHGGPPVAAPEAEAPAAG